MTKNINLKTILSEEDRTPEQQLTLFALLNLGILDSLTSGTISTTDALNIFFNAENCLFVRRSLHNQHADEVMSRGVQLLDLFNILPPKEAQHEFQRELSSMRALCLTLLEEDPIFA